MIPVTFTLNRKEQKGYLTQVSGSGSTSSFNLMVDNYFYGSLNFVDGSEGFNGLHRVEPGWKFSSSRYPELSGLAEYFGSVVVSALDSRGGVY